jgi:hypothetical protein
VNQTYEQLTENAREQSRRLGRYAAVVEIVTYPTGSTRTTVAVGTTPIRTRQRGGEFIGVMCQFHDGQPCSVQ